MKNIIGILGGAMAGILVTLEYLRETDNSEFKDTQVYLFDQNDKIFGKNSTSCNQSFKLHTGMHYMNDLETAKKCLIASIEFAKKFPDCIMQKDSDLHPAHLNKYIDRVPGRFYIVSGGAISMNDRNENDGRTVKGARYIANELNKLYKEMVEIDSRNEVFGPPNGFIKEISISDDETSPEYIKFTDKNDKSSIRTIEGIFEAREAQIDINKMRTRLERELRTYEERGRLKIHLCTKVESIQVDEDSMGYELKLINLNNHVMESKKVDAIVNCTWQNMVDVEKKLPEEIRNFSNEEKIGVRSKISILVQLPEGFEKFTTRIFASGPFCSITMTDFERKEAVLTFSPKSDLKEYTAGQKMLPQWISELTPENLTPHSTIGVHLAQEILKGCASFLPQKNGLKENFLKYTKILEIRLGHVCYKMSDFHNYDLEDPHSLVHQRRESGIEQRFLGLMRYACTKMTYGPEAARTVVNTLTKHLRYIKKIEEHISTHPELSEPSIQVDANRKIFAAFRSRIIQYSRSQEMQFPDILDILSRLIVPSPPCASLYINSSWIKSNGSHLSSDSKLIIPSDLNTTPSSTLPFKTHGSMTENFKN